MNLVAILVWWKFVIKSIIDPFDLKDHNVYSRPPSTPESTSSDGRDQRQHDSR